MKVAVRVSEAGIPFLDICSVNSTLSCAALARGNSANLVRAAACEADPRPETRYTTVCSLTLAHGQLRCCSSCAKVWHMDFPG